MLLANNLSFARNDEIIFQSLSFSLKAGECLHVLGPNGSGKTSLLRVLATLLLPHEGDIFWKNDSIFDNTPSYLEELLYLSPLTGVKNDLTVLENITFWETQNHRVLTKSLIRNTLETWELDGFAYRFARELSTGQKKRLALTKLLLFPTQLWLLDEPFTALDKTAIEILEQQLSQHLKTGGLAALSSHQDFHIDGENKKILTLKNIAW